MADDLDFDRIGAEWDAERAARFELEWRVMTLAHLKLCLEMWDTDPRAPVALDRLVAAARLAVS